jgi:hypothetical protein
MTNQKVSVCSCTFQTANDSCPNGWQTVTQFTVLKPGEDVPEGWEFSHDVPLGTPCPVTEYSCN